MDSDKTTMQIILNNNKNKKLLHVLSITLCPAATIRTLGRDALNKQGFFPPHIASLEIGSYLTGLGLIDIRALGQHLWNSLNLSLMIAEWMQKLNASCPHRKFRGRKWKTMQGSAFLLAYYPLTMENYSKCVGNHNVCTTGQKGTWRIQFGRRHNP